MDLSSEIAAAAAPGAAQAGLIIDSVVIERAGKRLTVCVYVDLLEDALGSAGIEEIAAATRAISAALDGAGIPDGPYQLEVSTPGVDRPLTLPRHFKRARTRLVTLILSDGTTAAGRLLEATDDAVVIDAGAVKKGVGGRQEIALAHVVSGRVEVEMKRAAAGSDDVLDDDVLDDDVLDDDTDDDLEE